MRVSVCLSVFSRKKKMSGGGKKEHGASLLVTSNKQQQQQNEEDDENNNEHLMNAKTRRTLTFGKLVLFAFSSVAGGRTGLKMPWVQPGRKSRF